MLQIRAEDPDDARDVFALVAAAFGRDAEARLVDALRAGASPFVSLVAEEGGALVGHVGLSPVTVGGQAAGCFGLAPLAVAAPARRRGVGAALVRAVLGAVRALGARGVVVLGEPAYYARFGFVPAAAHGLSCPWRVPDGAFQVLPMGNLPRGLVRYHAAFDAV